MNGLRKYPVITRKLKQQPEQVSGMTKMHRGLYSLIGLSTREDHRKKFDYRYHSPLSVKKMKILHAIQHHGLQTGQEQFSDAHILIELNINVLPMVLEACQWGYAAEWQWSFSRDWEGSTPDLDMVFQILRSRPDDTFGRSVASQDAMSSHSSQRRSRSFVPGKMKRVSIAHARRFHSIR